MIGMGINFWVGDVFEIVKVVLFLVLDDVSFVNGMVIIVDVGWIVY